MSSNLLLHLCYSFSSCQVLSYMQEKQTTTHFQPSDQTWGGKSTEILYVSESIVNIPKYLAKDLLK